MKLLTLTEYQTSVALPLSPAERDSLRRLVPGMRIMPSVGREGYYDLTPDSWVGSLNLGTLAVEIQPKLPISRVLFLLSYALSRSRWQTVPFNFAEESSLLEAIIPAFVMQVRRALRRGVLQGYRTEEAALVTVRGRIRFDDQVRSRYGLVPPVEVRYDEFTEDVDENRLLKATISRLGRLRIRSAEARTALRAFDMALGTVQLVEYDPRRVPTLYYTRLNEHYRPAVELARLILRSSSFEMRHGTVEGSAFLMDMNRVFEDFVVSALRDALDVNEREFRQGAAGKGLRLDVGGLVPLKPDLSWWEHRGCTFVGDVKYKRVGESGVIHADLYQLLAYAIATNLPGGLLIYGAGEREYVTHEVLNIGKELHITTLALQGTPEAILSQVRDVATQIRKLSQQARTEP